MAKRGLSEYDAYAPPAPPEDLVDRIVAKVVSMETAATKEPAASITVPSTHHRIVDYIALTAIAILLLAMMGLSWHTLTEMRNMKDEMASFQSKARSWQDALASQVNRELQDARQNASKEEIESLREELHNAQQQLQDLQRKLTELTNKQEKSLRINPSQLGNDTGESSSL